MSTSEKPRIIRRIGRNISDYFFGGETKDFYNSLIANVAEFSTDEDCKRRQIKFLEKERNKAVTWEKYIPNIGDIASLGTLVGSLVTESIGGMWMAGTGFVCSEIVRYMKGKLDKEEWNMRKKQADVSKTRFLEESLMNDTVEREEGETLE